MTRYGWLSALLLAAVGLYFSRGVLDIVGGPHGAVRVAMLPPLWEALAFAAALGGTALFAARGDRDPDLVLPLCALALIAVPYLPWLPDRIPILRGLAGPARVLQWVVVFWTVIGRVLGGWRWRWRPTKAVVSVAVFVVSAGVFGAAAWRLVRTAQVPAGDEPHYLVITQSLLSDRDLKIENNHQREDYRAYFSRPLKPDYLTRGRDGQIYSIHPVGLPVLAVPAFAAGGYPGVIAMQAALAALAAMLLWQWARDASGSAGAATFAWASAALTAPFLFNSFTVYPETPAALAVLIALAWRPHATSPAVLIAKGVAIGVLPWLSTKYAPMAAALGLVLAMRVRWRTERLAALVAPCVVLIPGWFAFFYWIWGTPSPSAPYGSSDPMTLGYLARGAPGLLFDQEYGIVAYAPVLALAAIGIVQMLRTGGGEARRAWELLLVFAALLLTVGAFRLWWGGTAAPGRPVASGVLLLGLPIANAFASTTRPAGRALCHLLLASSLAVAAAMLVVQDGTLLHNDRDGSAALIDWMSPTWPLASVLPSYVAQPIVTAAARTAAWLALAALVVWAVRRLVPQAAGAAALIALLLAVAAAVVLASSTRPAAAIEVEPEARARMPLLDEFDARRRPNAIVYEPFARVTPQEALTRAVLKARPGLRNARQPIELLWNARFSLPAGAYRVALARHEEGAIPASVGVQVGRVGAPLYRWDLSGDAFERRVVLPLDAALFGLRALSPGGLADGELTVMPERVVNESRRASRPQVISAMRYGPTIAFFHDDATTGEAAGYWTHGRGRTQVTYATPADAVSVEIMVTCGPIANRITLDMAGRSESFELSAGASRRASVPTVPPEPGVDTRLAPLDITVRDGFVPADFDRASADRRLLGCRIEMHEPQ